MEAVVARDLGVERGAEQVPLLDGDDSVFKNPLDDTFKGKPFETKPKNVGGPTPQNGVSSGSTSGGAVSMSKNEPKLAAGDTPPIDADAT